MKTNCGNFQYVNIDWLIEEKDMKLSQLESQAKFYSQYPLRQIDLSDFALDLPVIYDALNDDICAFTSHSNLKILPNLSRNDRVCRDSFMY
jgi:hypothetical protein